MAGASSGMVGRGTQRSLRQTGEAGRVGTARHAEIQSITQEQGHTNHEQERGYERHAANTAAWRLPEDGGSGECQLKAQAQLAKAALGSSQNY